MANGFSQTTHLATVEWVECIFRPAQKLGIAADDVHNFQLFVANMIDLLWSCRNKLVHDGKVVDVPAFSRSVNKLGFELLEAWRVCQRPFFISPSVLTGKSAILFGIPVVSCYLCPLGLLI